MATVGVINSTKLKVYIDGTAVAYCNDAAISFTHSPRDITTKDAGGYRALLEGLRQASISGSALFAYDAAYGEDNLYALLNDRTSAVVRLDTGVSGDRYYSCSAYCTQLDMNSPGQEDNAGLSFTFESSGTFTTGSN